MKNAQLIKRTETCIYKKNDGEVISLTTEEKIANLLFKPELCYTQVIEEVVERWHYRTKAELNKRFYDFIESNCADSRDYYLVCTD